MRARSWFDWLTMSGAHGMKRKLALLQLFHQRDLVAAGELGAAVALVPDLARQGHDVGLDEAEALEEGGAIGEGEDALQADAARLVDGGGGDERARTAGPRGARPRG